MKKIILFFLFISNLLFSEDCSWEWQSPLPQGNCLTCVKYASKDVAYACGNNGTIIKTTDGGENWELLKTNVYFDFNYIFAISSNICLAVGADSTIIKTTDGGLSWYSVSSGLDTTLNRIFFINSTTGWIVSCKGV